MRCEPSAVSRRPALAFIVVTVALDVMGIGLLLPVLPLLIGEFTPNRDAQALWYGALIMSFGAAQFLCAPLLGALSDRFGRRPVLLLAIAGLGAMFLASALVTSLVALLFTRIAGGALAANFSVANAYAADTSRPEDRARSFGLVGAAFGVGFIIGPALGGLLGGIDLRLPFYAAAGLSALNFLYGLLVLPESLPAARRSPFQWRRVNPFAALLGLARLRSVGALVAVVALTNLAQIVLHSVWVLYTTFRFGWGPRESGLSLFFVGVAAALVQGGLLGRLIAHFGERRLAVIGLASATLAYAAYGLATAGWVMYVIISANLLAFATMPALQSLVSRAADPSEQGLAMGAMAAVVSLMGVLAPLLGAPLLAEVSHLPAHDWRIGAPFFLSAALSAAAWAFAVGHFRRQRRARGAAPVLAPHDANPP
jgi:DHA1 family tetracycline resistance protein-like MFS transporter